MMACNKGAKSPEGLIEMYVSDITTRSVDRDYFNTYTDGELLATVQELSDEDFKEFITVKAVKNARVKILTKNCTNDENCSLTYLIKYDVAGGGDSNFKTEVKKLAEVKKFDDVWKLLSVQNLKTFHQALNPIKVIDN